MTACPWPCTPPGGRQVDDATLEGGGSVNSIINGGTRREGGMEEHVWAIQHCCFTANPKPYPQ